MYLKWIQKAEITDILCELCTFCLCLFLYVYFFVVILELFVSPLDLWLIIMFICDASSEFVSSSIPSWQILTAHAQPFRGARDLAFWVKVLLDLLLIWASSGGSGETARMRRLAWTFAARIGDKNQIRLTRLISFPLCSDEQTCHV